MNEELIMKASFIEKQTQELENNLEFINNQILELDKFEEGISYLEKSDQKEFIASLGKGVHVPATIKEKVFFVEVGSGVIVKKSPKETKEVIELQIKKMNEAKVQLEVQLDLYNKALQSVISEIEESQKEQEIKLEQIGNN